MRVPSQAFSTSLIRQLHQLNDRQNRLQSQAATGQRVQWADEDPAAMERTLQLQASGVSNSQYARNIDFVQERSTVSLTEMRALNTVLGRAGEIAILADDTRSPEELKAYAAEVEQLIRQAVESGNTRHRGDYLFGGTRTGEPPFTVVENADGQVSSVTYSGNTDVPNLEIASGIEVPLQNPGANTAGAGASGLFADSRSDVDVFSHLIALRDHLAAGDTQSIATLDRPAITRDEDHVLYQMADSGALQARLSTAGATARNRSTQILQAVSNETSADLAQTLVELSATQTAYRAALQSGANLLGVSLMDYLR